MNDYTYEDIKVGMNISFEKEITTDMEDMFRAITGDENPLHKDDDFAKSNSDGRFPRHVTFGMLTASLCSTVAGMYLPGKNSLIHSFDEISFKTDSFSTFIVFTVDFEYEDFAYSIKGESSILLSELFAALNIEQDLSAVTSAAWEERADSIKC